jgi:ABC-type multidrug transport system fused ATPase/permease subunit
LSLGWIVLLVLAISAFSTITPIFFKYLIDHLAVSPAAIPVLLIGAYIGAQSLGKIGAELRWSIYGRIEQRIRRQLALRIFDHVHTLSLRFHLERKTGALQQVVESGLLGYCLLLHNSLFFVIPLVFELVLMGGVMSALGKPVFVGILLVTAFLYIAVTIQGIHRQGVPQREAVVAQAEAAGVVADSYLS